MREREREREKERGANICFPTDIISFKTISDDPQNMDTYAQEIKGRIQSTCVSLAFSLSFAFVQSFALSHSLSFVLSLPPSLSPSEKSGTGKEARLFGVTTINSNRTTVRTPTLCPAGKRVASAFMWRMTISVPPGVTVSRLFFSTFQIGHN